MKHIHLDTNAIRELCQRHAIQELALFGSVTREDFGRDSDVDVLVEFKPRARVGYFGFAEIESELSALIGRKVDLVTAAMLSPFFRDDVVASRVVVYVNRG